MPGAMSGNAAEAVVLSAFVQRGFRMSVPFGDGYPYDLVLHLRGTEFLRIQCKTAWRKGGCLVFNCRSTDHGRGPQSYAGLADVFGVFFPPNQSIYLVPIDGVANFEGRLRLNPPRNNQRRGIRMAAEFEFDRWTEGRLRQLLTGASLQVA